MTEYELSAGLSAAEFHRRPGGCRVAGHLLGTAGRVQSSFVRRRSAVAARGGDGRGEVSSGADVDLRPEAVVVRVPYRGADRIPAGAADFAAEVSAAAEELALSADPSLVQTVDLAVAQHSGTDTRPFWTAALGYEVSGDVDSIDPLRRGPQLSFQPIRDDRPGRGRTHVDVSVPADLARARVDAAIAAGGTLTDDSYAPAWWTLTSPDNHGIDIAGWTDTYE